MKVFYDLHIHSCLSPCADNDMTPNNIAGMAKLKGLQVIALTDHNSCKNCPAFFEACRKQNITPIAGMELTTAEDIHLVCLFPTLDSATAFDKAVKKKRFLIKNRTDIFGEQIIMDGSDNIIGYEENLFPNATTLTIEASYALASEYGAVIYPAHVDRFSNGIISTLGTFPDTPPFVCAELKEPSAYEKLAQSYPVLAQKKIIIGSDAHFLWDISEAVNNLELEESSNMTNTLFRYLNGR
jgi:histidinol phosphatase-like PHP family hydrolase